MSFWQLFNSAASLFAAVVWYTSLRLTMTVGPKWSVIWRSVSLFISVFYTGLYFSLGSGLFEPDSDGGIVLAFRYAFPVLMLAPAFTQLSYRPLLRDLSRTFAVDDGEL
jgi:hypothetical protein